MAQRPTQQKTNSEFDFVNACRLPVPSRAPVHRRYVHCARRTRNVWRQSLLLSGAVFANLAFWPLPRCRRCQANGECLFSSRFMSVVQSLLHAIRQFHAAHAQLLMVFDATSTCLLNSSTTFYFIFLLIKTNCHLRGSCWRERASSIS